MEEDIKYFLMDVYQLYGIEINDIFFSVFGLMMKEWIDDVKIGINLEGYGWEDIILNVNIFRMVGWFMVQYFVVFDMFEVDVLIVIKIVKENLCCILDKGVGYGIFCYVIKIVEIKGFMLEISFNYLG